MTSISPFVCTVKTPPSLKRGWMWLRIVTMIHGMNQCLMMRFTERNIKEKILEICSEVEPLLFTLRESTIFEGIYIFHILGIVVMYYFK